MLFRSLFMTHGLKTRNISIRQHVLEWAVEKVDGMVKGSMGEYFKSFSPFIIAILLISALLGFGGISIWCQVYSLSKKAKPHYLVFPLCRIFHAFLSTLFTYIAIKVFNITLPTLSNGRIFSFSFFTNSAAVGFSLIILSILFMISLKQKNYAGNILEDIV